MGNTNGIGPLGTDGRKGGQPTYGTGVSRIKDRAESTITLTPIDAIIVGSLSMDIIRRVIHSHRDQIRYCYSQELTRNPSLAGKVTVRFTIGPAGYVQQASGAHTSLYNFAVERCMTQKIAAWKFPEPRGGGIVIVSYPFILKAD